MKWFFVAMLLYHENKYLCTSWNFRIIRLRYHKVASSRLSWLVAHSSTFRMFMKGKFHTYQKFPKLNSRPVYCSWLYGSYFSKIISPHCAPDDDERQGTTEWIGLIGSNNRQEIRPLPCSFALLIASTRTLIADGKNASDQLQISLSLWYNYTFLARCEWCARGHRYRTCPWLCGVAGAHTQCKCTLV